MKTLIGKIYKSVCRGIGKFISFTQSVVSEHGLHSLYYKLAALMSAKNEEREIRYGVSGYIRGGQHHAFILQGDGT